MFQLSPGAKAYQGPIAAADSAGNFRKLSPKRLVAGTTSAKPAQSTLFFAC
jgi:hypothetical protein